MIITIEGADGVGKSTLVRAFAEWLSAINVPVDTTCEPGGTWLGKKIRELVLHEQLDPYATALLMAADRAQHVAWLREYAQTRVVLRDRSELSSYVYQPLIGVDEHWLRQVNAPLEGELQSVANVAVIIDRNDDQIALAGGDRFETKDAAFQRRVRERYRALPFPKVLTIEGDVAATVEQVARVVVQASDTMTLSEYDKELIDRVRTAIL